MSERTYVVPEGDAGPNTKIVRSDEPADGRSQAARDAEIQQYWERQRRLAQDPKRA